MRKTLQKLTGAVLALLILLTLVCTTALAAPETDSYGFNGKTMSILGDSISTFGGVSNNAEYNSTIGNNKVYYSGSNYGITRTDTWWQQAIDRLGLELLVDNAWSGSSASTDYKGIPAAYLDRCVNLHNDNVANPEDPDIIAVFLGTNDVNINVVYNHPMGSESPDYSNLITEQADGTFTYSEPTSFADAYAIMLHKITTRYPDAEVYCLSLLQRNEADSDQDKWQPHLVPYNAVIRSIAQNFGAYYVDQYNDSGITKNSTNAAHYMANTLHPNAAGMDAMTNCFVSALLKNSKYSTVRDSLYSVSYNLNNYTFPAEGTVKTAVAGQPFSLRLTSLAGDIQTTVTMGGVDITEQCFADGLISIPTVTGDIAISTQNPTSCNGNHDGWTAITAGGTYENTSGEVQKCYLADDITGDLSLTKGEFILCMCGHSIQHTNIVIKAHFGSTVTLVNCKKSGGNITNTASSHGIEVYQNSSLTMKDGVSVIGCTKGNHAVFVYDNSVFNMEGGSIVGNTGATAGAVNLGKGSTFNMRGGFIGGNTSAANAGAVNVASGCTFNMTGGTISGNTATKYGGGIYVDGGTVTVSENAKLIGNTASTDSNGSAIYAATGSVNITGGYIENSGNSLYGLSGSVYDISGGTVKGTLLPGGSTAKFIVRDNAVIEGNANAYGIIEIQGGTVKGNVTAAAGSLFGKVYISDGAVTGTLKIGNPEKCVFAISGGKFQNKPSVDLLATDKGVLSIKANDGSDAASYPYVVGKGFTSFGEYIGHESAMVLGLYLNADVNFTANDFDKDDYTFTVTGGNENVTADFNVSNGNLLLTAHGIAAKEMHDKLTFTVKKDDAIWFTDTLSVYEAAQAWANDTNLADDTMLADMIAYGNAARKEFKYAYADGDVLPTLDGASTEITGEWTATQGAGVSNGQQDNVAVTLSLKDKIELNIYINGSVSQISNVKFGGKNYAADNYTVDTSNSTYSCVRFFNIPVVYAKQAVEFTVTLSDDTTFTVKYSIADYALLAKNGAQGTLIQELMEYVDSVSSYLGAWFDWPDLREDELGFIPLPTAG